MLQHQLQRTAYERVSKESNYLQPGNSSHSEMEGGTRIDSAGRGFSEIYGEYYLLMEKQTLVMWKTTTAEDRARGKIYLRGFTKVDPVEDRLKM